MPEPTIAATSRAAVPVRSGKNQEIEPKQIEGETQQAGFHGEMQPERVDLVGMRTGQREIRVGWVQLVVYQGVVPVRVVLVRDATVPPNWPTP